MAWSSLLTNQLVSRSDLQNAVTTGVFTLKAGQTIPGTEPNRFVTKSEVETWINAIVSNGTANQYPQKSWIIPDAPIFTRQGVISLASPWCNFQNFPTTVYEKSNKIYTNSGATTLAANTHVRRNDLGNQSSIWFWNSSLQTYNNSNMPRLASPTTLWNTSLVYTAGIGQNLGSVNLYARFGTTVRVTGTINTIGGSQSGITIALRGVYENGTGNQVGETTASTPSAGLVKTLDIVAVDCENISVHFYVLQDPPPVTGNAQYQLQFQQL